MRAASVALAHGEFQQALGQLEEASRLDPKAAGLQEYLDAAEQQRAVAETRTQRRLAREQHLAAARALLASRDLPAAARRVREALRLKANDPEALALQAQIGRARDEPHHEDDLID